MGLIAQVVVAAVVVAGQSIANAVGLGMANMMDPNLGNVPVISQFFIIISTLVFLKFWPFNFDWTAIRNVQLFSCWI